jgi:hypothetical protein
VVEHGSDSTGLGQRLQMLASKLRVSRWGLGECPILGCPRQERHHMRDSHWRLAQQ